MSAESVFVDTNILVYAFSTGSDPRHAAARERLSELMRTRNGRVSVQVLQELANTLLTKVEPPRSSEDVAEIVRSFGAWTPHRPSALDIAAAVEIRERFRISFWDAMILRSAAELECPLVWSEDFQAGRAYGSTTVENPLPPSPDARPVSSV